MKKTVSYLLMALAVTGALTWACNKPVPEPEPEPIEEPEPEPEPDPDPQPDPDPKPVDLVDFKLSVPTNEDWVFTDKPNIIIHVENPNSGGVMRHCGMTYAGTERRAMRNNRGVVDVDVYDIIPEA